MALKAELGRQLRCAPTEGDASATVAVIVHQTLFAELFQAEEWNSVESAVQAGREGAEFVLAGTIFKSPSHPGATPVGVSLIGDIVKATPSPVVAVGDSLTETWYWGFNVPEARINCYAYCWVHPNLGVVSAGLFIYRGIKDGIADLDEMGRIFQNEITIRESDHPVELHHPRGEVRENVLARLIA